MAFAPVLTNHENLAWSSAVAKAITSGVIQILAMGRKNNVMRASNSQVVSVRDPETKRVKLMYVLNIEHETLNQKFTYAGEWDEKGYANIDTQFAWQHEAAEHVAAMVLLAVPTRKPSPFKGGIVWPPHQKGK